MIRVTALDGHLLYLNPSHIISVEVIPETLLTLSNGRKVMVKESIDAVLKALNLGKYPSFDPQSLRRLPYFRTKEEGEHLRCYREWQEITRQLAQWVLS